MGVKLPSLAEFDLYVSKLTASQLNDVSNELDWLTRSCDSYMDKLQLYSCYVCGFEDMISEESNTHWRWLDTRGWTVCPSCVKEKGKTLNDIGTLIRLDEIEL